MSIRQVGDTVRLATTFKVGSVLTNPTTVSLVVRTPAGISTTYTLAAAEITNDSTGAFHKDVTVTAAGLWAWKWIGTGNAAGVDEGTITVESSLIGGPALIGVDEVKDETESDVADDDDLIQRLILAASRYVMRFTGREFVSSDPPGTARLFEMNGASSRRVAIGDLASAPSAVATSDGFGGAATVLAATDYVTAPRVLGAGEPIRALIFASSCSLPSYGLRYGPGYGVLSVTGTWGFPIIPEDVRHATALIVREWLSKSSSEWGMPDDFGGVRGVGVSPIRFAMPYASKQILAQYRGFGIF